MDEVSLALALVLNSSLKTFRAVLERIPRRKRRITSFVIKIFPETHDKIY